MTTVTFAVAGIPAPQGSKRHVGNGVLVESAKGLHAWRDAIAWTSRAAMNRERLRPFAGPVRVEAEFVMPRPKRCPLPTPPAIKRPDCDKLLRAVLDSCTHTAIVDDSQVVDLHGSKRIAEPGEPTGATITIEELQ